MRINNWSILYSLGYVIVAVGTNTFYKRHKVVGLKNIPKNKPIIFTSNHQNAFLDPVVIAVQLTKPTYYLVRADIFKKPIVAKIFDSINMMPIFRERDGVDTKNANENTFNRCFEILSKNRPIIIFPEGNHGKLKSLRPLKKGFARIASGAEDKYGKEIDVQIVPVGVNYSDHFNMGAELLINFGKPIDASDYLEALDDPREINDIKHQLEKAMSDAIIDIQKTEYYNFIHEMMFLFEDELLNEKKISRRNLEEKFKVQKEFILKAEQFLEAEDNPSLEEEMIDFKTKVEKSGLRYWLFNKEKHSVVLLLISLIIFAPIHLCGVLNNYLPYKLPVWFVDKKIKDQQFHSSMKMAFGVVFFFIFWLLQILIIGNLLPEGYFWYYAISLPLSAWISYQYWILLLKTKGKIQYNKLAKAKDKTFLELKQQREKFYYLFKNIVSKT